MQCLHLLMRTRSPQVVDATSNRYDYGYRYSTELVEIIDPLHLLHDLILRHLICAGDEV
jgi:hypothetical protein